MTAKGSSGGREEGLNRPAGSGKAEILGEYLDRLIAGETLDLDRIEKKHPDLAPELREQLEAFCNLGAGAEQNGSPVTLGDYTLRRQIGRGGMGIVYDAWQNSMNRRVALKILPVGVAADPKTCARFLREAQAAGKLGHPGIVAVHAMGVDEKTPYYAMEYVEGETLAQLILRLRTARDGDRPELGSRETAEETSLDTIEVTAEYSFRVARAFTGIAEGLQHAHQEGIIHRDIKPSNLILDRRGSLRILDFGLARMENQESLTLSGDLLGTPLYMSPEQARARRIPVDHRTDIYSLGATLYEVLTWEAPFQGKDVQETLSQIIHREPPSPRRRNPRIPRDLETIVLKCLQKDPEDRYGTAEALAQDLRRFARGDPIEARPRSLVEKIVRRARRHRGKLAAAVALLLLLAAAGSPPGGGRLLCGEELPGGPPAAPGRVREPGCRRRGGPPVQRRPLGADGQVCVGGSRLRHDAPVRQSGLEQLEHHQIPAGDPGPGGGRQARPRPAGGLLPPGPGPPAGGR